MDPLSYMPYHRPLRLLFKHSIDPLWLHACNTFLWYMYMYIFFHDINILFSTSQSINQSIDFCGFMYATLFYDVCAGIFSFMIFLFTIFQSINHILFNATTFQQQRAGYHLAD